MNRQRSDPYNWLRDDSDKDTSDSSDESDASSDESEPHNINDILDDVSDSDKDSDDSNGADKKKKERDVEDRALFNDLCQKYGFDYTGILRASYGCEHYRNACKVYCGRCPEGKNIYPCHKCHNEYMMKMDLQKTMKRHRESNSKNKTKKTAKDSKNDANIQDSNSQDSKSNDAQYDTQHDTQHDQEIDIHDMETENIERIQCIKCEHKQLFNDSCEKCKIKFAKYVCFTCKLMDNRGSKDDYYHCDSCKCCLVGKRSDYRHCNKCETCVQKNKISTHPCRKGMWDPDKLCSICQTGIRTQLSVIMVCGHIVHQDCFNVLTQKSYKCPECSKTIKDTRKIFEKMAREIDATPLHPDLQKTVNIRCNDCTKESAAPFHYIGIRCLNDTCRSFNTYEL